MCCPRSRAVRNKHTFDSLLSRCSFLHLRRYRASVRTASRYTHIVISNLSKSKFTYFILYVILSTAPSRPFWIFSPLIFLIVSFPILCYIEHEVFFIGSEMMDSFAFALNTTMPVFLVILLGWFLRRILQARESICVQMCPSRQPVSVDCQNGCVQRFQSGFLPFLFYCNKRHFPRHMGACLPVHEG